MGYVVRCKPVPSAKHLMRANAIYLESLAKFVAHQIIKQRIDAGRQIIQYSRNICHHNVNVQVVIARSVDGD